ncbi:chemotaxis protein CheW [Desulfobacter latus]|uniref:Chemotaxis protein CheW n=1 Tax=Desulfobacter latus TaxID=2292 RepID=A0A850TAB6_9BACT|nr:chemotaxis protein CheW [Desulfobacter latus]NWH05167.1 chemotaxis protein CheW [Desulfobacter latus]
MAETKTAPNPGSEAAGDLAENLDEGQCVVFDLADEEFGLEINSVKEIVRLPDITPIPRSPEYVSGICNLRGNVLPVIDTRTRFAMTHKDATDQTRLLVVENKGQQISLIVDRVREVMRMDHSLIEPPPAVCKGVDKEFLNGVVKVDEGKRLVLMLNLDEVVVVDIATQEKKAQASAQTMDSASEDTALSEEEQLVSFRVGADEYAFDIDKVSEILKVNSITAVPNVPDTVLGLFTIRNHLMPILDMRRILGLPSLISERLALLTRFREEEQMTVTELQNRMGTGQRFTGETNPWETAFGKWIESYNTSSVELELLIKRLKRERSDLYTAVEKALALFETDKEAAAVFTNENVAPLFKTLEDTISTVMTCMEAHIQEDQRTMVVESGRMTIGYLVDWVDEVLRIPKSVIDDTPAMARSDRQELRAVAKLDEGKRLIMIMDESTLVSGETSKALSDMQDKMSGKGRVGEDDRSITEQSMDEEQLVTFSINEEEYGLPIMQVQEINRLSDITHVPRAPEFIDGMTNLRGNVIPVINIRKLFGLEDLAVDDRTRVIIVDINGNRTGIRVDQVNEVLRLNKADIDDTPSIVTEQDTGQLMKGVCKIEDGKRMVVMLDVSKMLNKTELSNLKKMGDKKKIAEKAAPRKTTATKPSPKSGESLSIAE